MACSQVVPDLGAPQMKKVLDLIAGRGEERSDEMVDAAGIEPATPSMSTRCSPAELRVQKVSVYIERISDAQAPSAPRGLSLEWPLETPGLPAPLEENLRG